MTSCPPPLQPDLFRRLSREGLRLFFPLAALHGALWPLLWVVAGSLSLPASRISPSLWHGSEMLLGTFGAALIGFLTTALPEWTGIPRWQGRRLGTLALLWAVGRLAGLAGSSPLGWLSGLADLAWLAALLWQAGQGWRRHPDRTRAVLLWLLLLTGSAAALRWGLASGQEDLSRSALWAVSLSYLGLLGLVLARVSVPVTNLCLDPGETTTPFRPHPGRISLAPGLTALCLAASLAGVSPAVSAYLLIAAGAAFLDRCGETFVGPEFRRPELWGLCLSSAGAGTGLILTGAAGLGLPLPPVAGLHLALIGGLGMGVLMVFSIAGLFHTGRTLPFSRMVPALLLLTAGAAAARVLPDAGVIPHAPGPPYWPAATLWALALAGWLWLYLPLLLTPRGPDNGCG